MPKSESAAVFRRPAKRVDHLIRKDTTREELSRLAQFPAWPAAFQNALCVLAAKYFLFATNTIGPQRINLFALGQNR